ncbi:hypothetical protein TOPH_01146 [Tolypocladium ophioglossoides CBS 100239]|uniref:Uncharacterized protein n=1 Tax=Tolypocladium ophioglossoides (strain CBS 100239) TaxID=1163406 RepID=A0A0L0NK63_TOLOC|nr:hypothetical protein TOPH_01146 [Tolypocladium ophioglossoides CBS 100239]
MTDAGTPASDKQPEESPVFPGPPLLKLHTPPQAASAAGHGMLTVDFSTPLAGAARAERIKHMAHNHAQHALRRMPGVSSHEANELVARLQEVGQIVNQETTQLVDALMNLTLDQEDTDKAIARMSIEANLTGAKTDDQAQTITGLRAEIRAERVKREQVEAEAKKVLESFEGFKTEFKTFKDNVEKQRENAALEPDDLVKVGESAFRQGSPCANRRPQNLAQSLREMEMRIHASPPTWIYEQRAAQAGNAAAETHAECKEDKQVVPQSLAPAAGSTPIKQESEAVGAQPNGQEVSRSAFSDMAVPARSISAFQPMNRPPTAAPPKFGPLQAGPPRAPAAFSNERRFQGSWGSSGQGRLGPGGNSFITGSTFGQPARKTGFQPLPRYRPSGHDYHQSGFGTPQDGGPSRPASSFGQRREYYPSTPTSAGRNSRYGRFPEAPPPGNMDFGGPASSALVARNSCIGPPIHLTERAIAAWNEQVMEFYDTIRGFVGRHASEPDHGMAAQVANSSLWPVLLATYHPLSESEAASYLEFHLRNENSKSCVVTRLIIDYVVNRVWVPSAWGGSDSKSTYDLMDLEREFEATQGMFDLPSARALGLTNFVDPGQPSAARQPLLNHLTSIVGFIMKNEHGTMWHKNKVDDMARRLQATVQPLMNKFANQQDAYRDLEHVSGLAWELSSKILTSRLTFDFRFPEIGSRFSSQSMLPIWPHADPTELQEKHWRVALVTTPVITCRNDTGGSISAHSVAMADVFCMQ